MDDIILETRTNAEEVLSSLKNVIRGRMYASVEDFYNLCGIQGTYQDARVGWDELINIDISKVDGGYKINLPNPQPLSDLMSKE